MINKIICGDALDVLRSLPAAFVDCCVTSPPYFGLRNYGVDGQIGVEKSPDEYIAALVEIFREVRRTLKDDGTLWLNIGDSYAGGGRGCGTPKQRTVRGTRDMPPSVIPQGCKEKDLIGIPWALAFALRTDGWYLRQDIIWQKPNAMPESVTDRCSKSHEHIFLLSKSQRYYFDHEAIKEPVAASTLKKGPQSFGGAKGRAYTPDINDPNFRNGSDQWGRTWRLEDSNANKMRNKRDVWNVPTSAYKGAHFAVFPPALILLCILAGSKRGGVVLDPFSGSGTTALVSQNEGRKYIGIDLNPSYCEMAESRIRDAVKRRLLQGEGLFA